MRFVSWNRRKLFSRKTTQKCASKNTYSPVWIIKSSNRCFPNKDDYCFLPWLAEFLKKLENLRSKQPVGKSTRLVHLFTLSWLFLFCCSLLNSFVSVGWAKHCAETAWYQTASVSFYRRVLIAVRLRFRPLRRVRHNQKFSSRVIIIVISEGCC